MDNVKQYSINNPPPYPVTKVNNKTGEINLTATDVGALPSTTKIPTKVSELVDDSNFLTSIPDEYITEAELASKNYLTEVPSEYITETELNAKGYLTEHQDLSDYAKTENHYTKSEADGKYQGKGNYITEDKLNNYALKSEIPDTTTFLRKSEEDKQYIIDVVFNSLSKADEVAY